MTEEHTLVSNVSVPTPGYLVAPALATCSCGETFEAYGTHWTAVAHYMHAARFAQQSA